jgi:hypothetical protein
MSDLRTVNLTLTNRTTDVKPAILTINSVQVDEGKLLG